MLGALGRLFSLKLVTIVVFGLLGACASVPPIFGIISNNTSLKIANIVVEDGTNGGRRVAHAMREELRYEFSRNSSSGNSTKLHMEILSLDYRDNSGTILFSGQNQMRSHIRLNDMDSGDEIGSFDITVVGHGINASSESGAGRAKIRLAMMKQTARQTIHKIYGYGRASQFEKSQATHERESFRVPVVRPVLRKTPITRETAMGKLPPAVILEAKENPQRPAEPSVIKAPVLPVQ